MFNVFQLRKIFGPLVKTAPKRPKPRPTFRPQLEALEERWCPSTTWKPGVGSSDGNNAANYTNGLPSATNPLILDGTVANKPIDFTGPISVGSITVQNGYNSTLITDNGAVVSTSSDDIVKSGCILAIVPKAAEGGIELTNGAKFTIASGGTLNLTDSGGVGATFLEAESSNSGEYLNNAGTITWTGVSVGVGNPIRDYIGAPILNTGTFVADGGTQGITTKIPGQLWILSQDQNNTNNVSFDQTSGTCKLTNGADLSAQFGYYQSGGSLTSDFSTGAQACILTGGLTGYGDINIAGGKVVVGLPPNPGQVGVGTLQFIAGTAEINGEIDVNGETTGGKSTLCDLLDCTKVDSMTLDEANSYLNVGTIGSAELGTGNQWTVMTYPMNALKGEWAKLSYPSGMKVSTGASQVLVSN